MAINNKGFTLIELLVVFGVLAAIGGVTSDLFVGIIKGANKANIINEIKQNGNYALGYMDRVIRNSSAIIYSSSSELVLQDQQTSECVRFRIYNSIDKTTNGYITLTTTEACQFDSLGDYDDTTFSLDAERPLTNTDPVSGVSVTGGLFTINTQSGHPSTVSVNFTLSQGEKASSRNDFKASEVFQTLISLRTY